MPDTYPTIKVAAIQASPIYLDREATVEKTCRLLVEAADHGAKIVAFPECYIAGYPYYYYTPLTNPFPEEGKWFRELFKNSVEVPSATTERLCRMARTAHVYAVIGINEKDPSLWGPFIIPNCLLIPRENSWGFTESLCPRSARN